MTKKLPTREVVKWLKLTWFRIWMRFFADQDTKLRYDQIMYGTSITKGGKRVNPMKYINPNYYRPPNQP